MKRAYHPLLLCITVLSFAACDTPVAPAEAFDGRTPFSETAKAGVDHFAVAFPLPLSLAIPCINEEVVVGGGVRHLLMHEVENDNVYVYRFHLNHDRITGTGSETGSEYVGQLVLNEGHVSFSEEGATYTFEEHIHGVSKGSGPNFVVTILVHLTLNAQGDLTATSEFRSAECRG